MSQKKNDLSDEEIVNLCMCIAHQALLGTDSGLKTLVAVFPMFGDDIFERVKKIHEKTHKRDKK